MKTETKNTCPEKIDHSECRIKMLPVKDALDILSGKWKLQIILALSFSSKRFNQLVRDIPGLTPKVLSKELKELEINELISRTVYDTQPVSVEYRLTSYGQTLKPLIGELYKWGEKHRKRIIARK
jgi:DNA-binding HxlR family transcriptional regulator